MTYQPYCTLPDEFVEQVAEHGLDIVPELVQTLVNAAMQIERQQHLGAAPYERPRERRGQANGSVRLQPPRVMFSVPEGHKKHM